MVPSFASRGLSRRLVCAAPLEMNEGTHSGKSYNMPQGISAVRPTNGLYLLPSLKDEISSVWSILACCRSGGIQSEAFNYKDWNIQNHNFTSTFLVWVWNLVSHSWGWTYIWVCEVCAPYDRRTGEWKTLYSEELYNSHTSLILFQWSNGIKLEMTHGSCYGPLKSSAKNPQAWSTVAHECCNKKPFMP